MQNNKELSQESTREKPEETGKVQELKPEEIEQVSGGNFLPNDYSDIEYTSCGITVIHHMLKFDEFIWQGKDIGFINANKVMYFTIHTGRQPYTVEEAKKMCEYSSDNPFAGKTR